MRACMAVGLMLTACSSGPDKADYNDVGAIDPAQARVQEKIDAAANQVGAHREASIGVPVSSPTPGAAAKRRHPLPAAYQGYWGMKPADCELVNYDAAGRAVVEGERIRFRDAKARVVSLTEPTPNNLALVLRFEGDVQDRVQDAKLGLRDGGIHLVAVVTIPGEPGVKTFRYQRC
jgi:hypothetical protein